MITRDHHGRVQMLACPAYRNALQRLEHALDRNTEHSNAELIRQIRKEYFASVDELERSGRVVLPPLNH